MIENALPEAFPTRAGSSKGRHPGPGMSQDALASLY
jgi:hypothetical protein